MSPSNMIECHVDPRIMDLMDKMESVLREWAEANLNPEEIVDVIIMPHDIHIGHHRHRMIGGSKGRGGKKLPAVHTLGNTQLSPEGVQ